MIRVQCKEAEPNLGRLLDEAASGEDVIIEGAHGAAVRLVPLVEADEEPRHPIGHALDRYIGTWSAEQEAEVLQAVEIFERTKKTPWISRHSSESPKSDLCPFL